MAPSKKKANAPKVSMAEAAGAASKATRTKHSRMSAAATAVEAAEEETNNSTHGDLVGNDT